MSDFSRLVVLISGNGSNLQAVIDACAQQEIPATVVAVISNNPDAYGLQRAAKAAIPTFALGKTAETDRRAYDAILAGYVASYRPDYIILAGWMRILTSTFLDHFPGMVINLHPALPGTFPGTHAIERAYAAWQQGGIDHTGVMVHLVPDEGVDDGPVLATREIAFQPGESLEQFEVRMHAAEHELLVQALKVLLSAKPAKDRERQS